MLTTNKLVGISRSARDFRAKPLRILLSSVFQRFLVRLYKCFGLNAEGPTADCFFSNAKI